MKTKYTLLTALGLGLGLLGVACSGDGNPADGSGGTGGPGAGGSGTGSAPGAGGAGTGSAPGAGGDGQPSGGNGGDASGGNGGTGTGGGNPGSGGGPVVPEPDLVVSGPDTDARRVVNFWKEQPLTAGGTAATITVTSATAKQDWKGFGGTFNEQGWAALTKLDATELAAVMTLLFDVNGGIGFDWGRIPMGPSDYAVERYHLSTAAGQFDIAHDKLADRGLIPFIKESQKYKGDMKYWASPWTPPLWAKKSSADNIMEEGGYDKGIFDSTKTADYAAFFVSWIDAYEKEGIPIDFVVPQNEPGWAQSYPTCAFGPATDSTVNQERGVNDPVTFGPFIQALHTALQATTYKTKVWFGTMSNDTYFDDFWSSLTDKSIVEGVCLQWATQPRVGTAVSAGKDVMASEHKCGNYPWLTAKATSYQDANRDNHLESEAPNNYAYGEESWDLIKSWIDDGVNYYSAWNLVLDPGGFNLDDVRPWAQNAMIVVKDDGSYAVTPYYYVFRHIAQYVDLGAKVVTVTGDALAFKNPDGSVVVTVHNSGSAAADMVVSIDGTMYTVNVPGRGWATINKKP